MIVKSTKSVNFIYEALFILIPTNTGMRNKMSITLKLFHIKFK